jgi:hypothetical protein
MKSWVSIPVYRVQKIIKILHMAQQYSSPYDIENELEYLKKAIDE